MKTSLRSIKDGEISYQALAFICPGCAEKTSGLHMLPVNSTVKTPSWDWNGNLDKPTLSPSILTRYNEDVCHSFLRDGFFEFLGDSTHSLSGKSAEMLDIDGFFQD